MNVIQIAFTTMDNIGTKRTNSLNYFTRLFFTGTFWKMGSQRLIEGSLFTRRLSHVNSQMPVEKL